MANEEGLVLGGVALNDLSPFILEALTFTPAKKKPMWADNPDADGESLVEESRYTNSLFDGKLRIEPQASMDAALTAIDEFIAILQSAESTEGGITLVWTPNASTRSWTLYALTGEIPDLPMQVSGDDAGWFLKAPVLPFQITCRPFLYTAEKSITAASSTDPLHTTLVPGVGGDVSAEGRQVVTDQATQNRDHFEWGLEQLGINRINLITNPSIEIATTGWAGSHVTHLNGTATLSRVTAQQYAGAAALQVVTSGASTAMGTVFPFTVLAGITYTLSFYVKGNAGGETLSALLGEADGGTVTQVNFTATTDWQRVTVTWTASADTAAIVVVRAGAAVARTFFVDAVQVVAESTASAYFDGDSLGCVWTGAAHASTSNTALPGDLLLDSDELVTAGFAGAGTTRAGAYDPGGAGNSVIRATLTTTAVTVCGTDTADGDSHSHIGTFRVKARVFAAGTGPVSVRLASRVGDGPLQRNSYAVALDDQWCEVDLGEITIEEAVAGTQSWQGLVEGVTETPGDTLDVDYIELIPTGEGYGKARNLAVLDSPTIFSARDEFDQTAGALVGKVAPSGETWAGAGDSNDFQVETTGKTAQRADVSDTAPRRNTLPDSLGLCVVSVDFKTSVGGGHPSGNAGNFMGLVARRVDDSNYFRAWLDMDSDPTLKVEKVIATAATQIGLKSYPVQTSFFQAATWYRMVALIDVDGVFKVWVTLRGDALPLVPDVQGSDSALATAGTLASGHPGIYDYQSFATVVTRNYDNFAAWVPTANAVCFSGQDLEVRHDKTIREDSAGTKWGRPPLYRGSRFFLPPAGPAGRTSRIVTKLRRNDVDELPDDNIADQHQVDVHWRERYLTPR